jgi:hypothetical protein
MANDEYNATGTLENGVFKPYGEKDNTKEEPVSTHDELTDQLSSQSKTASKNAVKK